MTTAAAQDVHSCQQGCRNAQCFQSRVQHSRGFQRRSRASLTGLSKPRRDVSITTFRIHTGGVERTPATPPHRPNRRTHAPASPFESRPPRQHAQAAPVLRRHGEGGTEPDLYAGRSVERQPGARHCTGGLRQDNDTEPALLPDEDSRPGSLLADCGRVGRRSRTIHLLPSGRAGWRARGGGRTGERRVGP